MHRCDGPGASLLVATTPWWGLAGTLALLPYPCVEGAAARVFGLGGERPLPDAQALDSAGPGRRGANGWLGVRRVRFSHGGHYAVAMDTRMGVVTQWRRARPSNVDLGRLELGPASWRRPSAGGGQGDADGAGGAVGEVHSSRPCDKVARMLAVTGYDGLSGDDYDDAEAGVGGGRAGGGGDAAKRQDRGAGRGTLQRSKAAADAVAAIAGLETGDSDDEGREEQAEIVLEGMYANRGRAWVTRRGDVLWFAAGVVTVRKRPGRREEDGVDGEAESDEDSEAEAEAEAEACWWREGEEGGEPPGDDSDEGGARQVYVTAHGAEVTCLGLDGEAWGLVVTGDAGARPAAPVPRLDMGGTGSGRLSEGGRGRRSPAAQVRGRLRRAFRARCAAREGWARGRCAGKTRRLPWGGAPRAEDERRIRPAPRRPGCRARVAHTRSQP